jgi:hypothetical protein
VLVGDAVGEFEGVAEAVIEYVGVSVCVTANKPDEQTIIKRSSLS